MEFRQGVKSVFISVIGCHMMKISLKKQTDHDKKVCPKLKVPDPEVIIVSVMIPAPVACCYGYQRPICLEECVLCSNFILEGFCLSI